METENQYLQKRHHREKASGKDDHFRNVRQWLNIVFMIGAVVGVAVYVLHTPQTLGIIIILVAMVFKIIECALRFIK